jgi:hypothetical protein
MVKPALVARAMALVSIAVAAWANNVRWGAGSTVRSGVPMLWERLVVGATLLIALAAVIVWLATRRRGARWLRAAAIAPALAAAAIAAYLRYRAGADDLGNLVAGPGWNWLAAGAGLAVIAAVLTALATSPEGAARPASRKGPARKRAPDRSGR